jgi:hypothetical protein
LIESSLSSLPNYIMSVYLLPGQVHHKMDSARARFYWDEGVKRKYHMIKWEVMAKPREIGGLGFIDTRLMNQCLLSRWIVKLDRGDADMCTALLRKKYLKEKGFFSVNHSGGSQFWRGLHAIKYTCLQGLKYILGNGKKIRLWYDVWLGECPL